MKNNYSAMTLVGLGVIGMMAYAFIAPRLLSKPKPVAAPMAEPAIVPVQAGQVAPPVTVGVPNNMDPQAMDDLNMNFAGVTFAENIPGMSYGFPMAGVV
jgi:hypothetical protein